MAEPIGYDVNDGGINNQKLALLGLVIIAYETNAPIYLPKILSKDQRETRSSVHSFAEIFDESLFLSFLKRWNVSMVDAPQRDYADRIERCGWRFFDAGAWHLGQGGEPTTTGIVADFFRSLRPLVTQNNVFIKLCAQIFGDNDVSVVNQLRIEEDWRIHCQYNLDPVIKDPEDYNLSASDIIRKTRDTLKINRAFVSCDEKYIHIARADLTRQVEKETGVQILWKADFLDVGDAEAMRPIEASLIDFELAKISQTFVGMSRSTFANLATYERYCSRYRDYHQDYIYNFPSSRLALRVDHGRLVDPFEVCGVRRKST